MDDGRTELMPDFAATLTQMTSEATRRFCEQGQTVARTISEWNAEVSQFVSHRVARNNETIGRMSKCQNLPDVFAIQTQWLQDATEDYLKETGKLMEVNSKITGGFWRPSDRSRSTFRRRHAHRCQ